MAFRIFRLRQTSVTRPWRVCGSTRGMFPESGSPLGLPSVTSKSKTKSYRRSTSWAVAVMGWIPGGLRSCGNATHAWASSTGGLGLATLRGGVGLPLVDSLELLVELVVITQGENPLIER